MDVFEAVNSRIACRWFLDKPVEHTRVRQLLEGAARVAPMVGCDISCTCHRHSRGRLARSATPCPPQGRGACHLLSQGG